MNRTALDARTGAHPFQFGASALPFICQCARNAINGFLKAVAAPILGIAVFLFAWERAAQQIDTSLGKFPGPSAVIEQAGNLLDEHLQERDREQAFFERQQKRNAERMAKDPTYEPRIRPYTGAPTFFDQIGTSLVTVASGFILAALLAVPMGIAVGLSPRVNAAINPLIQLFKPVSPLAWLPLVTMVVSAVYVTPDPLIAKSFINSMITVTLCCLWPTVINTSVGVSSVDQDLINVSKVLRLNWFTHLRRIVLPSAVPMIFTGLRLSLGIAWMVLIAAEMLAQNPGLGKFVWDEFQNGSSASLGRIMVAVLTIGLIGFLLDRGMLLMQYRLSWDKAMTLR